MAGLRAGRLEFDEAGLSSGAGCCSSAGLVGVVSRGKTRMLLLGRHHICQAEGRSSGSVVKIN